MADNLQTKAVIAGQQLSVAGNREVPARPGPGHRSLSLSQLSPMPSSSTDLTPIRAHYLKKSLVSLQFEKELKALSDPDTNSRVSILSYLGLPFTPPPANVADVHDLLFFRFIFRQFVLTFPFFSSAPKNFFPLKLQPFFDSLISRNLTGGYNATLNANEEDVEELGRQKFLNKIEKQLTLVLGSSIKLTEKEDVVRLNQGDLDRLEAIAKRRKEKLAKGQKEIFEINVVAVRSIVEKKRIRNRAHDEFIIRTRTTNSPDIFVARRFGDFKTLWDELRKMFPQEEIPLPPNKDRSSSSGASSGVASYFHSDSASTAEADEPAPGIQRSPSTLSVTQYKLAREKNRLTLRSYLNAILVNPVLASSPVLRSFLTSDPITLTQQEQEDARRREEADLIREEGKKRFDNEVKARVTKLREAMNQIKNELMGKDGLSHIFSIIRATPNVRDLPPQYLAVLEWGRVTLASTIFQQLVASDSGSELYTTVKSIHGLMPYMVMKGILKISNPVAMIRGILDLFTAQPFGGRSLLQRMFISSLAEETKAIKDDIAIVSEKVDDPVLCEKIKQFVYAPRDIQDIYKSDSVEAKCNILTVILRSSEEPALNRAQMQRVARAARAHAEYAKYRESPTYDSEDDEGPENEDAWLYEDLSLLLKMHGRLRDKEQMIELILESSTAELLKDIITIFYTPLAQVYKAASIADSLGDLQNFMNDLIATVDGVEQRNETDPARTVQTFIDLVQRHEQAFYSFVYKVHTKGEALFNSLVKWAEIFITFMSTGVGEDISLEYLLPHTGPARSAVFEEVDAVALYHYKLKIAHEEQVRRRFGSRAQDEIGDAEEAAAHDLVDSVIGQMSIGELMQGDAAEIGQESEEEYTSSEEESSEEGHDKPRVHGTASRQSTSSGKTDPPGSPGKKHAALRKRASSALSNGRRTPASLSKPKKKRGTTRLKEPELKVIPDLLPIFLELIRPRLQARMPAV
ncbi:hypothetical protein FRB93_012352 [Tulasnella sp. JGI-2019a]|nr:hypothetical protein FRB93_012352 [Tulasnella sp. JGI-2019a]